MLTGLLAVTVGRSGVVPYVVEVDRLGEVRAAGPALAIYQPSDAQIAHFLARFVENVRSLSIDPVVVRANWLRAYDYVTDRGAQTLPEICPLDDEETLTYLHACVSTRRHRVRVPEIPVYLDAILCDEPFTGGL